MNKIKYIFIVIPAVLCVVFIAQAVAPINYAPGSGNTAPTNFDTLTVGTTPNLFDFFQNKIDLNILFRIPIQVINNTLQQPEFGLTLLSQHGGVKSLASYFGIKGTAIQSGNLFGRVGIEGKVSDINGQASGYVGFLEYDPNLTPDSSPDISTYGTSINADYIPISRGNPFAFYTRNKSKFIGNVQTNGNIATDNGNIVFDNGTAATTALEVTGTVTSTMNDGVTVDDFTISNDMSSKFSVSTGSYTFSGTIASATLREVTSSCASGRIRLSCSGSMTDDASPGYSNYVGSRAEGTSSCRAYAVQPVGTTTGGFRSYAFCYNPS